MRIGIDARFFGSVGKGLGRYTAELVRNLEKIASDEDEFVVFLKRENFDEYDPVNPRFTKVLADYPWYSLREQIRFPFLLRKYRFDLVHFPHFNVPLLYRRPFVVTIHDLILLRYPTVRNTTKSHLTYRVKFLAYRFVIGSAVRRAKRILTVSRFTERDIVSEYPEVGRKITVAYEGCDLLVPGIDDTGSPDHGNGIYHGILKPYFLYVGNAYPHKNLEAFIPLAKRFPDIGFVLVGKEDYFYRRFRSQVTDAGADNIVLAGFVPDDGLARLYRGAAGYVFPSLYEGFGLPPLEAMRFGIPVIAANRGSIPEILGDAALYFDPDDAEDLSRQLGRILAEPSLKAELSRRGTERAALYHWEDLARSSLRTYHEAVG